MTSYKINIRNSDLFFEISIDKILITPIKDAFKNREYEHAPKKLIDGKQIEIYYTIKNPYDVTYEIAIDDYFLLLTDKAISEYYNNKIFYEGKKYSLDSQYFIYEGMFKNKKIGLLYPKEYNKIKEFRMSQSDKFFIFKENEERKFSILFKPVPINSDVFYLYGFDSEKNGTIHRKAIFFKIDIINNKSN